VPMLVLLLRITLRHGLLRGSRWMFSAAGDREQQCEDQGQGMHGGLLGERDEHRLQYHFAGLHKDLQWNFLPMISFQ
jgi:hypothetical protein